MKTIKELNDYCKIRNFSIKVDRNGNLNGFKTFDYVTDWCSPLFPEGGLSQERSSKGFFYLYMEGLIWV